MMQKRIVLLAFALASMVLGRAAVSDDWITVNTVVQGFQTAGCGNEKTMLLRIDMERKTSGLKLKEMTFRLKGNTLANVSSAEVYQTSVTEFYAATVQTKLSAITPSQNDLTLPMNYTVKSGTNRLWLTVKVKDDAKLGDALDASLTSIKYSLNDEEHSLSIPSNLGDPNGSAKIYATQSFAYVPTSNGCKFYRIPAMILDKEGNIVVAADRRYNSNSDLGGNHKIDVSVRRSTDGGRTWSAQKIIATGDGSSVANCGYGDPALARTPSGRLICVMAAGSTGFFQGMRYAAVTTSDDNGVTWKRVRQIYSTNFRDEVHGQNNKFGFWSGFITSGKGLTTRDGTVMFATNCLTHQNHSSPQCYIISTTDEGNSWTLGPSNAYPGCDESKLEQLNNGDLMLSVRQSGARGFNTGSADAKMWDSPWRNSQISGNACNGDILYYSRETDGQRDIMLHSYVNSSSRQNLTIAMSIDGGVSWQQFMNIQPGGSAYSTMIRLKDGGLGLLYEDESYSAGNGYAITYLTITDEQINSFADGLKKNVGEEYQNAIETLQDGGVYYFATDYLNDEKVKSYYYLKADGRLTTDFAEAKYFTLQKRSVGNGFKPIGWKSGQFTNPTNNSTNTKYIRTDAQNRDDWDAQVFFRNAEGLYAIRATNAPTENQWGSNAYWTTDEQGNATYDLAGKPHYIWQLVKVGSTPRFNPSKTYWVQTLFHETIVDGRWWSAGAGNSLEVTPVSWQNQTEPTSLVGAPLSEFTFSPVSNVKGGFSMKDKETGKFVGAPSGSNWTTGSTAATLRIQVVESEDGEAYMIQAPFAHAYVNAGVAMTSSDKQETVSSWSKNERAAYWGITPTDEATSGISDKSHFEKSGIEAIYSADGIRLKQPQKGLNIIRQADGSRKKILH